MFVKIPNGVFLASVELNVASSKSWSVPANITGELAEEVKTQKPGVYKALISDSIESTQSL
jgi:hypothetical protein